MGSLELQICDSNMFVFFWQLVSGIKCFHAGCMVLNMGLWARWKAVGKFMKLDIAGSNLGASFAWSVGLTLSTGYSDKGSVNV